MAIKDPYISVKVNTLQMQVRVMADLLATLTWELLVLTALTLCLLFGKIHIVPWIIIGLFGLSNIYIYNRFTELRKY